MNESFISNGSNSSKKSLNEND